MPKIPDFSKFDLQGIVNSVKSIINPETGTPKVAEGDPIGSKIVEISTLLQSATNNQAQAAKELTQINNLLNELYRDLENFRQMEAEFRQKQQAEEAAQAQATPTTGSQTTGGAQTTGQTVPPTGEHTSGATGSSTSTPDDAASVTEPVTNENLHPSEADLKEEEAELKKNDQSPLDPAEGTSTPSTRD